MKVTSVPVKSVLPVTLSFPLGAPSLYSCWCIFPPLCIVRFKSSDKAFTTETPTPCKPPDTLYELSSNFPPA